MPGCGHGMFTDKTWMDVVEHHVQPQLCYPIGLTSKFVLIRSARSIASSQHIRSINYADLCQLQRSSPCSKAFGGASGGIVTMKKAQFRGYGPTETWTILLDPTRRGQVGQRLLAREEPNSLQKIRTRLSRSSSQATMVTTNIRFPAGSRSESCACTCIYKETCSPRIYVVGVS